MVIGHGATVVTTLLEYDKWKENVALSGFDVAFKNHHDLLHGVSHLCCRLEFSPTVGRVPVRMSCPECDDDMAREEYITFLCCHEKAHLRTRLQPPPYQKTLVRKKSNLFPLMTRLKTLVRKNVY